MEIKLYLETENGDDLNFDVDNSYYGNGDYISALNSSYETSKNDVSNFCLNAKRDHLRQENIDIKTFGGFNTRVSENASKVAYTTCVAKILNEEMRDETIDGLITHNLDGDMFLEFMEFDYDTMDEDFDSDLKMWVRTFQKIEAMVVDDEWKIQNYPKRTFKFSYKDSYGGEGYGEFINCKVIGTVGKSMYCVLIEKINFLKEL